LPTCRLLDVEGLLRALGLESRPSKKGTVWSGINPLTGSPIRPISVHCHARGRDVPNGTLNRYAKELGLGSLSEFMQFKNSLWWPL